MRKSLWLMLAVMVVAVSAPYAHADTVTTFNAFGSSFGGEFPLSGTMTIDTTTGVVTAANLFVGFPAGGSGNLTTISVQQPSGTDFDVVVNGPDVDGFAFFLQLFFPTTTLKGYQGGSFAPQTPSSTPTFVSLDTMEFAIAGGLTPIATVTTPEPASLLLLGTGLLGVAGIKRRRSGC